MAKLLSAVLVLAIVTGLGAAILTSLDQTAAAPAASAPAHE